MARDPVKKNIGAYVVEIMPMPATVALKIMTKLTKLLGPTLGALGDGFSGGIGQGVKNVLEQELKEGSLRAAAEALVARIDESEVSYIVETLFSHVLAQGPSDKGTRRVNLALDFAGELDVVFKIVVASLEVNFGGFFGGSLAGFIAAGRAAGSTA